jgi:hypothetical protein
MHRHVFVAADRAQIVGQPGGKDLTIGDVLVIPALLP